MTQTEVIAKDIMLAEVKKKKDLLPGGYVREGAQKVTVSEPQRKTYGYEVTLTGSFANSDAIRIPALSTEKLIPNVPVNLEVSVLYNEEGREVGRRTTLSTDHFDTRRDGDPAPAESGYRRQISFYDGPGYTFQTEGKDGASRTYNIPRFNAAGEENPKDRYAGKLTAEGKLKQVDLISSTLSGYRVIEPQTHRLVDTLQ